MRTLATLATSTSAEPSRNWQLYTLSVHISSTYQQMETPEDDESDDPLDDGDNWLSHNDKTRRGVVRFWLAQAKNMIYSLISPPL